MAISNEICYAKVEDLYLDPTNPRLGRSNTARDVTQSKVLELMRDWDLEELAISFMESGFWVQEALLVVNEPLYGKSRNVVVEGNRRLAALKLLREAVEGRDASKSWKDMVRGRKAPPNLFTRIPYLLADSRKDVEAFLGFRHVSGIMPWRPAEKAEYIAKLIETRDMSYEEVTRRIGSQVPSVRQHYISYRLLLQMQNQKDISVEHVEEKFSVLYLSLRTEGVKKYLQVDIKADPKAAERPVPRSRLKALAHFALWLFGNDARPPLFTDSRQVDNFGRILESREAVDYLEKTERPNFEVALRTSGGDEPELIRLVEGAADNIELALSRAHLHKGSKKLATSVKRLDEGARQLVSLFPDSQNRLTKEGS